MSTSAPTRPSTSVDAGARRSGRAGSGADRALWWALCLALLLVAVTASLAIGTRDLSPVDVWAELVDRGSIDDGGVIWSSRVPRTLIAVLAGAGLGLAGALIQAVTRNPLADPGILGVSSGSAFAIALAVGVLGVTDPAAFQWFAYLGALLTTVAVYLIGSAHGGSASPVQLTLAGVAIGAVLSGIISAIVLTDPAGFQAMRAWESGNLEGRGWTGIGTIAIAIGLGVLLTLALGPSLNAVALGDDAATALGANVALVRVLAVLAVTVLAGGATALAGPIAFVGLMVPHVCRWLVGPDQRWILGFTLVLAPLLLVSSDVLARIILPGEGEVPVGIVTAFVGAPVLIALVRRRRASGL